MSRRKPIKEFPTAARKTTFAPIELRYTSQRTSESAPASRNQCIRRQGFIIICRGEPFVVLFRYTPAVSDILPVTNSTINFNALFYRTKFTFL